MRSYFVTLNDHDHASPVTVYVTVAATDNAVDDQLAAVQIAAATHPDLMPTDVHPNA